jgi:hypothetical protein
MKMWCGVKKDFKGKLICLNLQEKQWLLVAVLRALAFLLLEL